MSYEQIVSLVKDLGFPIFVAGYLLLRQERTLREFTKELNRLVCSVEALAARLCSPPTT